MLRADDNGTFGFTLQGASIVTPTHDMVQSVPLYPVIGYVEPNSVAERCGILQPGDRILSVNKNSLEGLSLEDARQIIKDAGANLNLEIEFDVAGNCDVFSLYNQLFPLYHCIVIYSISETIILSSGIFQVKLLKKNLDLGISVACKWISWLTDIILSFFLLFNLNFRLEIYSKWKLSCDKRD